MGADISWQIANRQELAKDQLTGELACDEILLMAQHTKAVGDRVRRTREALKANLPEFAKLVGTDKGTLSNIEHGKKNFTVAMAIKLKRKKGIPLDWIYCADPARLPKEVFEALEITEVA